MPNSHAKADPVIARYDHDDRLRPVLELARSCNYEQQHTHHVTDLSRQLFDALAPLHRLDAEARFLLTAGALLHDIGWVEGQARHHKTALRYIRSSALLPWDERLRLVVGSIARYHRKALPKTSHDHFKALNVTDRRVVSVLGGILRVADGLDYGHCSVVRRVSCACEQSRIVVHCACDGAADTELARAKQKADLLEETTGRTCEFLRETT